MITTTDVFKTRHLPLRLTAGSLFLLAQAGAYAISPVRPCTYLQDVTVTAVAPGNSFTLTANGGAGPSAEGAVVANLHDANFVSANSDGTPAHCKVRGTASKANAINFELRLPSNWNGKFFFQGGAGLDGFLSDAMGALGGQQTSTALMRGYAVVAMDSGHQASYVYLNDFLAPYGSLSDFGVDPTMRTDYAYKAVGTMTDSAKSLIRMYYGQLPAKSYFVGCSNGGRQAFLAATRFADKFDGVLAGAPAINISKQLLQGAWDAQQLATLAPKPADAISISDMNLVGSTIRAACDSLDGGADGMVADVAACQTKLATINFPNSLICQGSSTSNCLPAAKVNVLKAMMGGPRNSANQQLYSDWSWDAGMETHDDFSSWRAWRHTYALGFGYPIMTVLGGGALAKVLTNSPVYIDGTSTAAWNFLQTFSFDNLASTMDQAGGPFLEAVNTQMVVPNPSNLSTLRNKGGKIIVYTGSADPTVSLNDITKWFNDLKVQDASYNTYARLYVVPGMNHCNGGPATDVFDLFTPLENWTRSSTDPVSPGTPVPPGLIVASLRSNNSAISSLWSNDRQRPLCEYPKVARYNGAKTSLGFNDYIKYTSFTCQ